MAGKDDSFLAGPWTRVDDWACPKCYAKGIRGNRLDCYRCHYKPSHSHVAAAKQREKIYLSQKGAKEKGRPQGGGEKGGSNGSKENKALEMEVAALKRKLAEAQKSKEPKEAGGAPAGGVASAESSGAVDHAMLDEKIARYEKAITQHSADGEVDMAAQYRALLDKAKQQKLDAKGPSSKQKVLYEQKKVDKQLDAKRKQRAEFLEAISKAQADLAAVDKDIDELQEQSKKLEQRAQVLAAEDAQKGHGEHLLEYVSAIKGACAKKMGDDPGFLEVIQQFEQSAKQIQSALQKLAVLEEEKSKSEVPIDDKGKQETEQPQLQDTPMLDMEALDAIYAAALESAKGADGDDKGKADKAREDFYATVKQNKRLKIRDGPYGSGG